MTSNGHDQIAPFLEALVKRYDTVTKHWEKAEQIRGMFQQQLPDEFNVNMSVSLEGPQSNFKFRLTLYIQVEKGEIEILSWEDVEVTDQRGSDQILECLLNKAITHLADSVSEKPKPYGTY